MLSIINNNEEPVFSHESLFEIVDDTAKRDWVKTETDNVTCWTPKSLQQMSVPYNLAHAQVKDAKLYINFCKRNNITLPHYLNPNCVILRTKADVRTGEQLNPSIKPNTLYIAIAIKDKYYRVINDKIELILFEKSIFDVVDDSAKYSWCRVEFDDDCWIQPFELVTNWYLFSKFFDDDESAIQYYYDFCKQYNIRFKNSELI